MNPKKVHESPKLNQIYLQTPKTSLTDETPAIFSNNRDGLLDWLFKIRTDGFK